MELYRPKLIENKTSSELKEGIIQALRELIISYESLFENENKIRKIQISKFILDERKQSAYNEVDELEKQTNWKFNKLFEDCIAYPDKSIYPSKYYSSKAEENSICYMCDEYVHEITDLKLKICDKCLLLCKVSLESKTELDNCLLFRTPEEKYWCSHSNENTLLLSTDKYCVSGSNIVCIDCILEETNKRNTK